MMKKILTMLILTLFIPFPVNAYPFIPAGNCTANTTISEPIINDFHATVTRGQGQLGTDFLSDVSGQVSRWKWTFEPRGPDYYSQHPIEAVHTFRTPGVYDITLTVWGMDGKAVSMTKYAYIHVYAPIYQNPCKTDSKQFQKRIHCRYTGHNINVIRCDWDFGDGNIFSGMNFIQFLNHGGHYNIRVTFHYKNGKEKVVFREINIF